MKGQLSHFSYIPHCKTYTHVVRLSHSRRVYQQGGYTSSKNNNDSKLKKQNSSLMTSAHQSISAPTFTTATNAVYRIRAEVKHSECYRSEDQLVFIRRPVALIIFLLLFITPFSRMYRIFIYAFIYLFINQHFLILTG